MADFCLNFFNVLNTKVNDIIEDTSDDYIEDVIDVDNEDDFEYLTKSLTPNVLQRNWITPTEFPLCPYEDINMESYFRNLEKGKEFCINERWKSIVFDYAISADSDKLWVVCDDGELSR